MQCFTSMIMEAKQIRKTFLDFFQSKEHKIVPSAPITTKDDPTLLFTNAGMNQFKDYFLGHRTPPSPRIADTQKCLRVSGKHNDLEEVGVDSYHHTMFEMLGNWSFGDYFKEDAINWGWQLLTERFGIDPDRLYVTIFGGDKEEDLELDAEACKLWERHVPQDRILHFGKKDNFWEMGDTGPCGPCSEIHVDLRPPEARAKTSAKNLVNKDHPQVIEIWNLVFIQYNRKADGSLEMLPAKHVDTGMGFERLCMVLQQKLSSYDTDLFTPYIQFLEGRSGIKYTSSYHSDQKADMAMRVIADHIRAVSFTIADGALPGSGGAGYVVRRVLRRAVRYYYSFLDIQEPVLFEMVNLVADFYQDVFPEVAHQRAFITKVILEEEKSFLRTLEAGLKKLDSLEFVDKRIDGDTAFLLYDTYGFPIDLTRLIARDRGLSIDESGFDMALQQQRNRAKADAQKSVGDWQVLSTIESEFVGYDSLVVKDAGITRYRTVTIKGKPQYQAVLDKTPFYAEGGGQVGDTGVLQNESEQIKVLDTVKENNLFIHILDRWPENPESRFVAKVNEDKRHLTENNHSATHLMHAALRDVLGSHVNQKGSLVNDQYLRFDFSHFQKMTPTEIKAVEGIVNKKIRSNIVREERRDVPIAEAEKEGAMMLFGEKYGERVRMITFESGFSVELCGGCHVPATGQIGLFKITSESAIAAGVRRIEAVTADGAEAYLDQQLSELQAVRDCFKNSSGLPGQVSNLLEENKVLQKKIEKLQSAQVGNMKGDLLEKMVELDGINFLAEVIEGGDSKSLKNLIFQLEKDATDAVIILGLKSEEKAQIMVAISRSLVDSKNLHAGNIVKELAKHIRGGGGGQPFFASAGGSYPEGLHLAIQSAREIISG